MSNGVFVLSLAVGAAALAVWIQVRFPSLAPVRLPGTMLHAALAFTLLKVASHVGDATAVTFSAIILPALVYALLCSIWMLKVAQIALGFSR